MRPKQATATPQDDLFRARLENLIDLRHPLVRLAGLIDWGRFETEFGALYTEGGRPGLPTRLMVGLHLLKHMDGLSDEAVCARYLDSPYVQLFCGEAFFQHALPLDRSSMTRWRRRLGPERLEVLLAESLAAAQRGGARRSGGGEAPAARHDRHHGSVQGGDAPHRQQALASRHRDPRAAGPAARDRAAPVLPAGGEEGPA
jgi:IS5 family transposase